MNLSSLLKPIEDVECIPTLVCNPKEQYLSLIGDEWIKFPAGSSYLTPGFRDKPFTERDYNTLLTTIRKLDEWKFTPLDTYYTYHKHGKDFFFIPSQTDLGYLSTTEINGRIGYGAIVFFEKIFRHIDYSDYDDYR